MSRKLILAALAGALFAAPALAKDGKKDSDNFFDITDEIQEAGNVVQTGANKTASFFEGLFDDDDDKSGGKKKKN